MPEPSTTEPGTVLVCAEDAAAGELLTRLLARAGWSAVPAAFSAEGLADLDDPSSSYAGLVLDLHDPTVAVETLRAVRGTTSLDALRVVVCSPDDSARRAVWAAGADAHLAHPFDADAFVAEVAAALARPEAEREEHRRRQVDRPEPAPED